MTSRTRPVFPDTDIYGITAEEHSRGRDNVEVVARMLDAGIKLFQYREKTNPCWKNIVNASN